MLNSLIISGTINQLLNTVSWHTNLLILRLATVGNRLSFTPTIHFRFCQQRNRDECLLLQGEKREWPPNKKQLCPKPTKFIVANQTIDVTGKRLYLPQHDFFWWRRHYKKNILFFQSLLIFPGTMRGKEGSIIQRSVNIFNSYKTYWDSYHMAAMFTICSINQEADYNI